MRTVMRNTITWFEMGDTVTTAGMHFDTFSLYFSILRADISAQVNPRGLKLTLFESVGSSESLEIDFNPSTLKGWKLKIERENKKYRSACQPWLTQFRFSALHRHSVCENRFSSFRVVRSERLPFSAILDQKSYFLTGWSFFTGVEVWVRRQPMVTYNH